MKILKYIIIALFLAGCSTKPVYNNIYKDLQIQPKPVAKPYELKYVKFNKHSGYFISDADAKIMAQNWVYFKNWSEYNYNLLLKIKESK